MREFYTDFFLHGKRLFLRGYDEDGERFSRWQNVKPTLYIPCDPEHKKYETIEGQPLAPIYFNSPKEAKEFDEMHERVYGFSRFQYVEIDKIYPGKEIAYEPSLIRTAAVDIETECEKGFPDIDAANEKVNLVTVGMGGIYYTFSLGPVDMNDPSFANIDVHADHINIIECDSELELLRKFVSLWRDVLDVDIVTGWNIGIFDLPYLVNRMKRISGEELAKKLSPFERLTYQTTTIYGKQQTKVSICGIATLDYMDLYKKFKMKMQESYKLDHIAHVELGKQKLEYEGPMHRLYQENFSKWTAYNIQDVYLIHALDEKLQYVALACQMAYMSKCRLEDVFSAVRMWDVIINNYLVNECGIQGPFGAHSSERYDTYDGAYVKDPLRGKHEWVCSFDLASLYPCLIMQYNIGPDTILNPELFIDLEADDIVNQTSRYHHAQQVAEKYDATLTGNGSMYRRDQKSFMATLMERVYQTRKSVKKQMLEANNELQEIEAEIHRREAS